MRGMNVLCAAETGSGKTLAYLLPLLEKLYRYRQLYGPTQAPGRPIGVVITPSRELADQILGVAKSLSEVTFPFVADVKCGGHRTQLLLRSYQPDIIDLLIATPGVFSKLLSNKMYDLSRLSFIVLDEADTLLDDSFSPLTLRIIQKLKIVSEGRAEIDAGGIPGTHSTQVAFVGATLPRDIRKILGDIVPVDLIETVRTDSLHKLLPHISQKFERVGLSQKPEKLLMLLKTNVEKRIPTLVFCNKSSTACFLGYFLDSNNVDHILLHANMPQVVRNGRYEKFQNGDSNILISTDIASRGLDTIRVRQVINYEFPHFVSDYIHRVGRIGRVGSGGSCLAVSFVCYKWDVDLLWKIETAARMNIELDNVNANIKRKLWGLHQQKQLSSRTNLID